MYCVITEFTVAPARRDDFERTFTASAHATLPGVPGLQRSQLLRPAGDGRPYLAVLEFDDEAAFHEYASSPSFRAAHRGHGEPVADDHRVTSYEAVAQIIG